VRSAGEASGEVSAVAVLAPMPMLMVSVAPRPEGGSEITFHAGGQGFWVARIVAELGLRATLCVALGGRSGRLIEVLIEEEGVSVARCGIHRSSASWISSGPDGEPATIAATPTPPLNRHEVDRLYGIVLTEGIAAGTVVLTGLANEDVLPLDFFRRLSADLTRNGVTVVADTSWGALWEAAAGGADVVKVSRDSLVRHGAVPDRSLPRLRDAIDRLRAAGAARVLVSCEDDPALAHTGDRLLEVVPPRLDEVNFRGAGDSTTGALAAALARGSSFEDALPLAIAAGALNVTRRGLGTGDRHSIELLARSVEVRVA
jgi:1-phosphofructokinase